MSNLFVLNESFTNGFRYYLLVIISIISILCGIFVITSKNPIVSVLFLIGLFLSIAGYLMMLGLNFIGLSYLLVYVGAVSILFLFILMLINVRISELTTDNSNSIPLAVMIGIFFNMTLYRSLPSNLSVVIMANDKYVLDLNTNFMSRETGILNDFHLDNNDLLIVSSKMWDGMLAESSHITSIGNIIYTNYPLWLILTSIILLLAMVGAIIITIKQ